MQELINYQLTTDPYANFLTWIKDAENYPIEHFNAMILATVDFDGCPDSRTVLYKGLHHQKLYFYTSYDGNKAKQLEKNPHVAGVFYWHELGRQVRFKGKATKISREENDSYFQARAKESQLAALISAQSHPVSDRNELMAKFEKARNLYQDKLIPTPENWGGYAISVHEFEFFLHSSNRLNDRFLFTLVNNSWQITRLQP